MHPQALLEHGFSVGEAGEVLKLRAPVPAEGVYLCQQALLHLRVARQLVQAVPQGGIGGLKAYSGRQNRSRLCMTKAMVAAS